MRTPSPYKFFCSFYHVNTYLPLVDLSPNKLDRHLFKNEHPKEAAIAQRLISVPEVQQILSSPLAYEMDKIRERNAILEKYGFKLLSSKPGGDGNSVPFYSVSEHGELPGWIIKSGAIRVTEDRFVVGPHDDRNEMVFFTAEDSLLRIAMVERIKQIAEECNIEVVIPKKKLVEYANLEGVTEPTRRYCVICEKIEVLSVEDTVEAIKAMKADQQRETARKIATLVKKVGFVDASFHNIRLTPNGKIAVIDTEPAGLLMVKQPGYEPGLLDSWSIPRGASVEKCGRIGLFSLMGQTLKGCSLTGKDKSDALECEPGLEIFRKEVETHYQKAVCPKLSKERIVLSIVSLGILPLIYAIIALVKTIRAENAFDKLMGIDRKAYNTFSNNTGSLHRKEWESLQQEAIAIDTAAANRSFPSEMERDLFAREHQVKIEQFKNKVERFKRHGRKEFEKYQRERVPVVRDLFASIESVPYTFGSSVALAAFRIS